MTLKLALGAATVGGALLVSAVVLARDSDTSSAPSAVRCSQLAGQTVAGATIDRAETVSPGTALPPIGVTVRSGFCRVSARISPVPDSEIKMEVWLPLPDAWNGKFVGIGGGGTEGGLGSAPLMLIKPVMKGYAGVATNAGHDPSDRAEWALGHPEKIIDYGYRANHLGAVVGKAVASAYYALPVKRAYFQGCSNGGRDALMLAQRYPHDYDAIAAGAPANDFTRLLVAHGQNEKAVSAPGVDLTKAKLKLLNDAVIKKCDMLDGVEDRLLERPLDCRFDAAVLQCKADQAENCLSKADVKAVRTIYGGVDTGRHKFFSGYPMGGEYDWANWITAKRRPEAPPLSVQLFRYMVYDDPTWDLDRSHVKRDYEAAQEKVGPVLDATNPDLRPFIRRGGKLLMYHGWDDGAIPATATIRYFTLMQRAIGAERADQTRLFMVPGMGHCFSGTGPDSIDYFAELDRWTETGAAPERVIATKYNSPVYLLGLPTKVVRTRPVCAWPMSAHYKGTGSIDDEANFVCRKSR